MLHLVVSCASVSPEEVSASVCTCKPRDWLVADSEGSQSPGNKTMSESFSTELIPVSDRVDAWQWRTQQICGNCYIQLPKHSSFYGSIESRRVGSLQLSRFSSSSISFRKCPAETASPENRCCILITQLRGVRHYSQNGVSVTLRPSDSTLIDSGLPWSSSCPTECARLYVRAPRWLIEDRLQTSALPLARRIPGNAQPGAALFRVSRSLYRDAEMWKAEDETAALETYFNILSACIGLSKANVSVGQRCDELTSRIQSFIETHLTEPTTGPAEIAGAVGISVRHLHRLFSLRGHTVGDWIRWRRLLQCRRDLADPRLRERTITEIAFFWGFSDSAHFSRCFRTQFGMCPRVFRSGVPPQSWGTRHNDEGQGLRAATAGLRYPGAN
jgi:AraC family transcriptional regulator, positive regulator of tynA and feaB